MPSIRRLAYRDRFVWSLDQTMTGGASALPPFQFPADGSPGEFLVRMTESEWIKVFSALMTGADLSYPEQSHEVVWSLLRDLEYPLTLEQQGGAALIWGNQFTAFSGAAMVHSANTAQFHNLLSSQSPPAITQAIQTIDGYLLQAGNYRFDYLYAKTNASGIFDMFWIDPGGSGGVVFANLDQYNAATQNNQRHTGTFTLPATDVYKFRRSTNLKNGSSSNYTGFMTYFQIWRE